MLKRISAIAFAALSLWGQSIKPPDADETRFFEATAEVTVSGADAVFTIQLPAKSEKRVYLQLAYVKCSAACTVQQERNGTAATATAVAPVALNTTATPAATLYKTSNSTSGAALAPIDLNANAPQVLDMSFSTFAKNASGVQNHTWRVAAFTGTVRVGVIWGER
jgi:hypothetical protein